MVLMLAATCAFTAWQTFPLEVYQACSNFKTFYLSKYMHYSALLTEQGCFRISPSMLNIPNAASIVWAEYPLMQAGYIDLSLSLVEAAVSRQAMLHTAFFSGSLQVINSTLHSCSIPINIKQYQYMCILGYPNIFIYGILGKYLRICSDKQICSVEVLLES